MKLLKNIILQAKKLNNLLGIQSEESWLEYKNQWLKENNISLNKIERQ